MVRVTKIIKYEYDYEIYTIGLCNYLVYFSNTIYNIALLKDKNSFLNLSDEKKVDFLESISHRERFHILSFSQINELRKTNVNDVYNTYNTYYFNNPPSKEDLITALNENRIFCVNGFGYDHLIHSIRNDASPIVPKIKIDYVGTVLDNLSLKWEHVKAIKDRLKNNSAVISIVEKDIPYYNSDEYKSEYLELNVTLSENECRLIWDSIDKSDYESKIKIFKKIIKLEGEVFIFKYFDFYNIGEFIRSNEEIEYIRRK